MVARDDLERPLGAPTPPAPGKFSWAGLLAAFIAAGSLAWFGLRFVGRPRGEAGSFTAPIVRAKPKPPGKPVAAPAGDMEDGVLVVRGDASHAPGQLIRVPSGAVGGQVQDRALSAAPDPGLVEASPFGPLPKTGANGATPFSVYKRPADGSGGPYRLAVVLTGMGLNPASTTLALSLPPEIAFAFASVSHDLWRQAASARQAGHELLLQAPMESLTGDARPWPHELTTVAGIARNLASLHWSMAQFPGYMGVMNFQGSKLTADKEAFQPLLAEIAGRGLAYFDDGSSPLSLAKGLSAKMGMPFAEADLRLDPTGGAASATAIIDRAISLARMRGHAVLVAPALPEIVTSLKSVDAELDSAGVTLVPVSALMRMGSKDQADRR